MKSSTMRTQATRPHGGRAGARDPRQRRNRMLPRVASSLVLSRDHRHRLPIRSARAPPQTRRRALTSAHRTGAMYRAFVWPPLRRHRTPGRRGAGAAGSERDRFVPGVARFLLDAGPPMSHPEISMAAIASPPSRRPRVLVLRNDLGPNAGCSKWLQKSHQVFPKPPKFFDALRVPLAQNQRVSCQRAGGRLRSSSPLHRPRRA